MSERPDHRLISSQAVLRLLEWNYVEECVWGGEEYTILRCPICDGAAPNQDEVPESLLLPVGHDEICLLAAALKDEAKP